MKAYLEADGDSDIFLFLIACSNISPQIVKYL
jgi:hypothetical protein